MGNMSILEFKNYCEDKEINLFSFDSLDQSGDRYERMYVCLKDLRLCVMPAEGLIILYNDSVKLSLNGVKYIIKSNINDDNVLLFDIVCDSEHNHIHSIQGYLTHNGEK